MIGRGRRMQEPRSALDLQRAIDAFDRPPPTARRANPPPFNDAFRRWFEGSVAVDRHGAPLVLYHGTRSPIDFVSFESGTVYDERGEVVVTGSCDSGAHLGPHFAEEAHVASNFAEGQAAHWDKCRFVSDEDDGRRRRAGPRVIPVFLSVRKVKWFPSDAKMSRWILKHGYSRWIEEEIQAMLEEEGGDTDDASAYESIGYRQAALGRLEDQSNIVDDSSIFEEANAELGESARLALIERGYDAVRYKNDVEGGYSWVALKPGSVKSAIANSGAWDPESEDIFG